MRKITSIATALLLGGICFTANAAVSSAKAVATPVSGTEMATLIDEFTVSWGGETVALNTDSKSYSDFWECINIEVYVDGVLYEEEQMGPDLTTSLQPVYAEGKLNESEDALSVMIGFSSNFENAYPGQHEVEFKIPEGVVLLGADGEENAAFSVNYTVGDTSTAVTYLPTPDISPASGTPLNWPETIYLSWEADQIELAPGEDGCYAVVLYNGATRGPMVDINFESSGYFDDNGDWVDGPAYAASIDWYSLTVNEEDWSTKTGQYTIIIEKGMIANANDPSQTNDEIILNYTLKGTKGGETITPKPEDGLMFNSKDLSAVTVTWEGMSFSSVNNSMQITAVKESNEPVGPMALAAVNDGVLDPSLVKVDLKTATITLDLSSLEEGKWHIEIPSGYASFDEYTVTDFVQLNYTIFNGLSSAIVLQPTEDIINAPVPVELTWANLEIAPTSLGYSATLSYMDADWNDQNVTVPASAFSLVENNHVLNIDVVSLLKGVTGNVSLKIPEGMVQSGGLVNPEQEIQFRIIPAYTGTYEATISGKVLTLTFEDASGEINVSGEAEAYILSSGVNVFTLKAYENIDNTNTWDGVIFNLGAANLKDGQYQLVIPSATIYINNSQFVNNEITIVLDVENGVITIGENSEAGVLVDPTISPVSGTTLYGWPVNVELQWEEAIYPVGDEITVNVVYNGVTTPVVADIIDNGTYDETAEEYVPAAPYTLMIDWAEVANNPEQLVLYAGDYTITVPAGVVKNEEGNENAEYSVTYTLYNVKGWDEITPDPNDWNADWTAPITYKSSELAAVNIEFPAPISAVDPQPAVIVTSEGDEEGVMPLADNELDPSLISISGNSIILDLSGYGDGDWSVYIPAGFAKIDDNTYTNVVEFTYHISNSAMGEAEVIGGLENYSRYSSENAPTYALVTWDYAPLELGEGTVTVTLSSFGSSDSKVIELPADAVVLRYAVPAQEGGEPSIEPAPQADADDEEGYNAIEINFGEYIPEGTLGYVAINIPAGMVTSNGTPNPAFTINYDIMPVYDGKATFINVDGEVQVYWGDMLVYVNVDEVDAYVADSNGNEYVLSYESPYFGESDSADVTEIEGMIEGSDYPDFIGIVVRLNNLKLEDGNYTLWIPTGFVTIHDVDYEENWFNQAAYWQFNVLEGQIIEGTTGIESIETAAPAIEGVYNLQGVKMSNDLKSLAPGLYIINGKKVLIRK